MLKSMLKDGGGLVSLVADENSDDLSPTFPPFPTSPTVFCVP